MKLKKSPKVLFGVVFGVIFTVLGFVLMNLEILLPGLILLGIGLWINFRDDTREKRRQ